jgi:hypothetical protein
MNQTLAASFAEWRDATELRREGRRRLQKICRRIEVSALAAAFDGWSATAARLKYLRRVASSIVVRLRSRLFAASFLGWWEGVLALKEARRLAGKALRRAMSSFLVRFFSTSSLPISCRKGPWRHNSGWGPCDRRLPPSGAGWMRGSSSARRGSS